MSVGWWILIRHSWANGYGDLEWRSLWRCVVAKYGLRIGGWCTDSWVWSMEKYNEVLE